ncbi:hypothetical protein BYT27DRAFT_7189998 [Phlegmacium glaucopus]|nr:hypothetical protein BYT27DRAFT_7189998 [Phlegmacium glaucopus]
MSLIQKLETKHTRRHETHIMLHSPLHRITSHSVALHPHLIIVTSTAFATLYPALSTSMTKSSLHSLRDASQPLPCLHLI